METQTEPAPAAPLKSASKHKPILPYLEGPAKWLVKFLGGYGSSIVLSLVIIWAIKLAPDDTDMEGAATAIALYALGHLAYLFLQGILILTITGGRNIGKDLLSIADVLLSVVPAGVLGFIVYGWFDSAATHPLSWEDWLKIWVSAGTVLVDVVILGWLGARISRLMPEMNVTASRA